MRIAEGWWMLSAALAALAAGGVPSAVRADPPPPTSWVGHTQKELIEKLGEPESVRVRPDGTVLLEYLIERHGVTCRYVYLALPNGVIAAQKDDCV